MILPRQAKLCDNGVLMPKAMHSFAHFGMAFASAAVLVHGFAHPSFAADYQALIEQADERFTAQDYPAVYAEIEGRLGLVLFEQEKFAEAVPHLKQARALDPDNVLWIYGLGSGYAYVGQYEEALKELDRAVELAPDQQGIRDFRDGLRQRLEKVESARLL